MKKLFIILLSALSLTAMAQKKSVAVLTPICRDNSVNLLTTQIVRGAIETAITNSNEYEAFDRASFDQIVDEHNFQRSGAVSDSQIKHLGEMAGVDYIFVSELSSYSNYMSVIFKILNVETGKYDKSIDELIEYENPQSVKTACNKLASSFLGQEWNVDESIDAIFAVVEEMPEFPGGESALVRFASENLTYPIYAQKYGIQGRVICEFTVNKDGSIVDVKVVRSSGDPSLDKEAVRICYAMPRWKPGKQRGKPVRVKYTIPINFRLQ